MSVKKNFIYNMFYQILIVIIPLITTPYLARIFGPEGTGIQSYTFSIANYFVLFAMLGVNNYGSRTIASVRDNKKELSKSFFGIYLIQFMMSIISLLLYCGYIFIFVNEYKVFFIIQSFYIISAFFDINWFFFGIEKFKLTVIRNTLVKLATVICIFIFVKSSNDLYKYSVILSLGTLISQLILWKYIKLYIVSVKLSKNDIFKHIKPNLVLFIPVISISIYKIMDKIMIGSMTNVVQVGLYENSEKILAIPLGVISALGTVMLPKMSNLKALGDLKESKRYIVLSMEFIMFIAWGSVFGLIAVAPILIPIFLEQKFIDCIPIVSLLAITLLFVSWANVIRTQFLIPNRKDKIYLISTIAGAIINLLINLLLIRRLGAIGATIGTIFAELIVCVYQTIKVRSFLDIKMLLKKSIFYVIPGVIMYFIVSTIGKNMGISIITILIQVISGVLIYGLIGIVYMIKTKNEVILNIIKKIRLYNLFN